MSKRHVLRSTVFAVAALVGAQAAHADLISGELFYTLFSGGQNVNKVAYSYDEAAHAFVLGAAQNVASTNGADGIIFAPNGNLLIGGQGSGNVYELNPTTGALIHTQNTGAASYHLALDPTGTKVFTSDFGGALKTLSMPIGSGVTSTGVSGGDGGVTGVAFNAGGAGFYVNGSPNGHGNVGKINVATGSTTRLFSGVEAAHGMVYDRFTGLMTMFGDGDVATFDADAANDALIIGSLKQTTGQKFTCDFDQGAVDGKGHALVAGCSQITFIDYHLSGDITHPDYYTSVGGFGGIDDVAPLSGLGSNRAPEPGSLMLVGLALAGVAATAKRRVG